MRPQPAEEKMLRIQIGRGAFRNPRPPIYSPASISVMRTCGSLPHLLPIFAAHLIQDHWVPLGVTLHERLIMSPSPGSQLHFFDGVNSTSRLSSLIHFHDWILHPAWGTEPLPARD